MSETIDEEFRAHLDQIRAAYVVKIAAEAEVSATYKSFRKKKGNIDALKAAAREVFKELQAAGNAELQNQNKQERAARRVEAEKKPSPESIRLWTDEDTALLGALEPDVEIDDLIR